MVKICDDRDIRRIGVTLCIEESFNFDTMKEALTYIENLINARKVCIKTIGDTPKVEDIIFLAGSIRNITMRGSEDATVSFWRPLKQQEILYLANKMFDKLQWCS